MRLLRRGRSVAALATGVLAACELPGRSDFEVRDSTGVRVVESHAASWAPGAGWRVSPTAAVEFPTAAGPGQVVGAVRLSDGRLAVADAAAGRVRYHGPDGVLLLARDGDREARPMTALSSLSRLPGDSLLAFDGGSGRLRVLAPDGTPVREASLDGDGVPLDRAYPLADGTVVVRTGWRASSLPAPEGSTVVRPPVAFLRFGPGGALLDTIAVVPGDAVATVTLGAARTFLPPLLGHVTVSAAGGDALYVGTGEAFEIRVLGPEGAVRRVLRVPGADLAVSGEEIEEARAARAVLGTGNPLAQRILALVEGGASDPASRPAYAALRLDAAGNLWVAEYPRLGPGGDPPRQPRVWTVFDPGGSMLGPVEMPEALEVMDIGEDYVLGLRRGSAGEENVVVYPLVR